MTKNKLRMILSLATLLTISPLLWADFSALSANDITILFPIPQSSDDVDEVISLAQLAEFGAISEEDFESILNVALSNSAPSEVSIRFPELATDIQSWKVAGIRIDPSAPGSSPDTIAEFGSYPQIRLVVQPVSEDATVHDFTLHLIYDFLTGRQPAGPANVPKGIPNSTKFSDILSDLLELKAFCRSQGFSTDLPLDVHPCARSSVAGEFGNQVEQFLATHLRREHLNSGAAMGLPHPAPGPWVFLSFKRDENDAPFAVFASPGVSPLTSPVPVQMLSFVHGATKVHPQPSTTNLLPANGSLVTPVAERRGVSTAPLFLSRVELDKSVVVGVDANQQDILTDITFGDIADIVANPAKSHFFNTDCVSCHSESTRRSRLSVPKSAHAYVIPEGIQDVNPSVLPSSQWNVRNFGWFGSKNTISQRTANETAEALEFIHKLQE